MNDSGFIDKIVAWLVRGAFWLAFSLLRLAFMILGFCLRALGKQMRRAGARRGYSLALLPIRPDILKAVTELEYSGQKEFTTLSNHPNFTAQWLVDLGEQLDEDEHVLTVRSSHTGPDLRVNLTTNIGILALTSRRVIFIGTKGLVQFPYTMIDDAHGSPPAFFIRNSMLRVVTRSGERLFGFLGQWHGGGEMAQVITARCNEATAPSEMQHVAPSHTPRVTSPGPQLSPDGRYWWDGTSWRVVSIEPPAQRAPVQYSPDGHYWWDGAAWQPVQDPGAGAAQAAPVSEQDPA